MGAGQARGGADGKGSGPWTKGQGTGGRERPFVGGWGDRRAVRGHTRKRISDRSNATGTQRRARSWVCGAGGHHVSEGHPQGSAGAVLGVCVSADTPARAWARGEGGGSRWDTARVQRETGSGRRSATISAERTISLEGGVQAEGRSPDLQTQLNLPQRQTKTARRIEKINKERKADFWKSLRAPAFDVITSVEVLLIGGKTLKRCLRQGECLPRPLPGNGKPAFQ